MAAYDRAVAEGNDFVVGPLGRDEVSALFAKGTLPVPVLALNRGNAQPPAGTASFSLSPEDEGIAAAEYLLDHGARRVLVIGGGDDTQRRAVASLRERLGERGAHRHRRGRPKPRPTSRRSRRRKAASTPCSSRSRAAPRAR